MGRLRAFPQSAGLARDPTPHPLGRPAPPASAALAGSSNSGDRVELRGVLSLLWWLNRGYCAAMHRLILLNDPPLPDRGAAILVANHTSGVDNFVLQAASRRVLGFVIAQEFYDSPVIGIMCRLIRCIPVRRDGRDIAATRAALRALSEGRVLPIFPEGRITPKSGREFGPGKPGAAFLALRSGVPVVPAYIRGTPECRTVWEAGRTPSRTVVLFGPPVDLADLRAEDDPRDERDRIALATDRLMDAIKGLREESLRLAP